MTTSSLKKHFLSVFMIVFIFSDVFADENHFESWKYLHGLHIDVLREENAFDITPIIEVNEDDFKLVQQEGEIRHNYLELMSHAENYCYENRDSSACIKLSEALKTQNMLNCLGSDGSEFPENQEAVKGLAGDMEQIFLASGDKSFEDYSSSTGVANMIATLRTNLTKVCTGGGYAKCSGKRKRGSDGKCWLYVKYGLRGGGYTSAYPSTGPARDAGQDLKRIGFVNLKETDQYKDMNGRTAPVGAILVYDGGRFGHIEVKAGENSYLSDFESNAPINEKAKRRLIGVYVKP